MRAASRHALSGCLLFSAFITASPSRAAGETVPRDRRAFALVGARVIAAPGKVFPKGVVVVRGGTLEAVGGEDTPIPKDARVLDVGGKVVHAAFLDPYVPADRLGGKRPPGPRDDEEEPPPRDSAPRAEGAASHPLSTVRADASVLPTLQIKERVLESYRRLGYAVLAAAPQAGILRGRGALVALGDSPGRVLAERGHFIGLDPERFDFATGLRNAVYPVSRMGVLALVRQSFLDAIWYRDAQAAWERRPAGQARPRYVAANVALLPAAEGKEPVVFESSSVLGLLRGTRLEKELKLRALHVASGDEWRLRDQVKAARPDLILKVSFPKPERLEDDEWLDVPLSRLRHLDRAPSNPRWLRDAGLTFSITTAGLEDPEDLPSRIREALQRGLSQEDALAAVTTVPARQLGLESLAGTLEPGRLANLVVATGEPFARKTRVLELWVEGQRFEVPEKKASAGARGAGAGQEEGRPERSEHPERSGEPEETVDVRPFPARDDGPLLSPGAVVVRGATVWTMEKDGVLKDADLLVVGGKVKAVGRALTAPTGAHEVDGRSRHVTPGLIDAHSHTAVDDTVNEFGSAVSAEVRIKDVLDPLDVAIYRELAGGTTTANVLHGSANTIGGQNAILKWRPGGGPEELVFEGAPEGIKLALGENPKRSNVQERGTRRYPATRMGVAALLRERFLAARDYRRRQEAYRREAAVKGATPIPPAPDLQLEAIAEILEGTRKVHCHSYRKDEILEVLRVAEEMGFRIATLQHVLEGYKVADEIARHGAGASTFSDWWAYKQEVYDAIPYNAALMRERGVLVSLNSDSDELARRLNGEAAKTQRYGDVPPEEALAFVTTNPARQLGIEGRVGSLSPGKDADFVIWSGDPLSPGTSALQTWVDGRKRFDREADLGSRDGLSRERAELVSRAKRRAETSRPKPTTRPEVEK